MFYENKLLMPAGSNKRLLDSPESTQSPKTTKCVNSVKMNDSPADIVSTLRTLLSEELTKERQVLLDQLDARFLPVAMKADLKPMQDQLNLLADDSKCTKGLITALQTKVNQFEETLHVQNKKLESLERRQRSKNLIFINVDKNVSADMIQMICRDVIKAPMLKIVVVGVKILNVRDELATALVTFQEEEAISEIFANVKNLKGSRLRIDYDLSPELRARRSFLMALKRELLTKQPTTKMFVQQDKIKIGDKRFAFRDGRFMDGENDARDFLFTNFNVNFDLFLDKFITEGKGNRTPA